MRSIYPALSPFRGGRCSFRPCKVPRLPSKGAQKDEVRDQLFHQVFMKKEFDFSSRQTFDNLLGNTQLDLKTTVLVFVFAFVSFIGSWLF